MSKKTQTDIQRINQALSAAISSINLAKNLLKDIEGSSQQSRIDTREIEGIVGVFDGTYLITADGQKIEVPVNYASKSKIVFGDTLKMVEDQDKKLFKQIERVKRLHKVGILSKKDGQMVVVTGDGTYNILQVAVEFYGLTEGGQVQILIPEENVHAPFAAIDKNLEEATIAESPKKQVIKPEEKTVEVKKEEKKIEVVKKPEPVIEKVVEKVVEKVIEKKVVARPSYTSNKSIPSSKPVARAVPARPVSKKAEINSISSVEKPKTNKLVNDDNSISRIIGDDDLR